MGCVDCISHVPALATLEIPGHEGRRMLDRLDSVIFAAPVFFHLVRHGWAG